MTNIPCPECGQPAPADAAACLNCGHSLKNGTARRIVGPVRKPPPPPELAGLVIEATPPEIIEESLRTFNEEEWQAALREFEETGGVKFEDFIGEIEEIVKRRG